MFLVQKILLYIFFTVQIIYHIFYYIRYSLPHNNKLTFDPPESKKKGKPGENIPSFRNFESVRINF